MTNEKCACPDCVCHVDAAQGIVKDEQVYCSEACANGHKDHAGCDHTGCNCHG